MRSMFISLGLTIVLACSALAAPKCHTSEIFECVDIAINWVHSLPKRSIPETEDQVNVMCEELGKAMDCALKYRDSCVTPLQKEVVALVIEGATDFRTNFCNAGSSIREKYLSHATCLNKVSQMDEIKEQIEYILAVIEKVQYQEDKNKIMYGCCGYRKIHGRFLELGIQHCGKEGTDLVIELIQAVSAQILDVICNDMDGTEQQCQSLLPPEGTKASEDANETALYKFLRNALKNWIE